MPESPSTVPPRDDPFPLRYALDLALPPGGALCVASTSGAHTVRTLASGARAQVFAPPGDTVAYALRSPAPHVDRTIRGVRVSDDGVVGPLPSDASVPVPLVAQVMRELVVHDPRLDTARRLPDVDGVVWAWDLPRRWARTWMTRGRAGERWAAAITAAAAEDSAELDAIGCRVAVGLARGGLALGRHDRHRLAAALSKTLWDRLVELVAATMRGATLVVRPSAPNDPRIVVVDGGAEAQHAAAVLLGAFAVPVRSLEPESLEPESLEPESASPMARQPEALPTRTP
jgi:hypothetical protein